MDVPKKQDSSTNNIVTQKYTYVNEIFKKNEIFQKKRAGNLPTLSDNKQFYSLIIYLVVKYHE